MLAVGILNEDGSINNAPSIKRLAEVAVAYARAGRVENNSHISMKIWSCVFVLEVVMWWLLQT